VPPPVPAGTPSVAERLGCLYRGEQALDSWCVICLSPHRMTSVRLSFDRGTLRVEGAVTSEIPFSASTSEQGSIARPHIVTPRFERRARQPFPR